MDRYCLLLCWLLIFYFGYVFGSVNIVYICVFNCVFVFVGGFVIDLFIIEVFGEDGSGEIRVGIDVFCGGKNK